MTYTDTTKVIALANRILKADYHRFHNKMPLDMFDDLLNQPVQDVPLDFLPEMVGHSDPAYLVEELEQENIELFGVNFNGLEVI